MSRDLFLIISSSNYREVDIEYITPKMIILGLFFFSIKHMFLARKIQSVQKLFRIRVYFEKVKIRSVMTH